MRVGKTAGDYKPNDQYYTPEWIFEKLAIRFDLDVASPTGGIPWIPADNHYDEQKDGLLSDWFGTVWMNPPFSKQRPWIEKFIQHKNGIALLPWSKSISLGVIWNEADAICMLPSNLKFQHKEDGPKGIFVSVGLFAFGDKSVEALQRLDHRVR
jgi:hypothetical protein